MVKKRPRNPTVEKYNITDRKRIPNQKRNELNKLVDKLLKITTSVPNGPGIAKLWELHLEAQKLVDRIQQIESEIKTPGTARNPLVIDTFTKWVLSNGAEFDGVQISEFPGYELGLKATKPFKKGSLVMTVPEKVMLTCSNTKNSILASLMKQDRMLQNMPNISLALVLIVEKLSTNSFWKPYIDILPERYNTVLYYSLQDLSELKGSPTLEMALKQCQNIGRQYAYFNKLVQTCDDPAALLLRETLTYDLYRWAVSTVMTRQNAVPWGPSDSPGTATASCPALIPLWDMANQGGFGEITTEYNPELERLESSAMEDFNPGDQILIFYGKRSDAELFIHNGFLVRDNPYATVPVRLGVSDADPLVAAREKLLAALGLPRGGDLPVALLPMPITPQLLGYVRVFNMNKEQIDHWSESDHAIDLLHIDCALDHDLEVKTWKFLLTRLQILLAAYPTTLLDDLATLHPENSDGDLLSVATMKLNNAPKPNPFRETALQLRIAEKNILRDAIEYVKQRIGM